MGFEASSAEGKGLEDLRTQQSRTQNVEEDVREEECAKVFSKPHPFITVMWAQVDNDHSLGVENAESKDFE